VVRRRPMRVLIALCGVAVITFVVVRRVVFVMKGGMVYKNEVRPMRHGSTDFRAVRCVWLGLAMRDLGKTAYRPSVVPHWELSSARTLVFGQLLPIQLPSCRDTPTESGQAHWARSYLKFSMYRTRTSDGFEPGSVQKANVGFDPSAKLRVSV
jgi:hypothetical protein